MTPVFKGHLGGFDGLCRVQTLRRARKNSLFELVFTIAIALGLAFAVQALAVKPYRIPSGSMEPTLKIGQRVLVNRLAHRLGAQPHVGDVVVFRPPANADAGACGDSHAGDGTQRPCDKPGPGIDSQTFIKRVVAIGGDTIAVRNGHAIRNGKQASEPFTAPCGGGNGCDFPEAVRVPKGYVFLMGDNRGASDDSRYWGPVPVSQVIGKAFATYWPPSQVGGV
jgi:signal peptidase I